MSIELPPPSSHALSQALADLMAQRQAAGGTATPPASVLTDSPPSAPAASSLLDLSAQARLASAASLSAALTQSAASTTATPLSLPASGVDAPTQGLLNTLLQQLQGSSQPLQASSIQAWPTGLLQQLQAGATDAQGQPLAEALPPLQTWLVQQGTLLTRDGPRNVTLNLYVPAAWLGQQTEASAGAGMPMAKPPVLALPPTLAQRAAALPSGVFALVLQAGAAPRTSALLHIEFAPQQQAAVYGKPALNPILDPWQQQAVLQASEDRPDAAEHPARHSPRCDTPHCPYAGAAACPQPFCPALHLVAAVTGPTALPG